MNDNAAPTRKPKSKNAKIFGTFIIREDGTEELLQYTEHYSKPQAQSKALDGRVETREASIDDLMRIGADGIAVERLAADFEDETQHDAFRGGDNE